MVFPQTLLYRNYMKKIKSYFKIKHKKKGNLPCSQSFLQCFFNFSMILEKKTEQKLAEKLLTAAEPSVVENKT